MTTIYSLHPNILSVFWILLDSVCVYYLYKMLLKFYRYRLLLLLFTLFCFFWVEFSTLRDNTFDQLCINYCNERFQQYFVNLMLDQEKKWYNAQNLKVPFVQYLDNSQIIGMFYKILNSNRIMNDSMNYCLYHSN